MLISAENDGINAFPNRVIHTIFLVGKPVDNYWRIRKNKNTYPVFWIKEEEVKRAGCIQRLDIKGTSRHFIAFYFFLLCWASFLEIHIIHSANVLNFLLAYHLLWFQNGFPHLEKEVNPYFHFEQNWCTSNLDSWRFRQMNLANLGAYSKTTPLLHSRHLSVSPF